MVLKNVGNTKNAEDYLNYLKKRVLKETVYTKPKNEEPLDESLIQVFPTKKESENTRKYKDVLLANETGLRYDEDQIKDYIIENKERTLSRMLKEIEKCDAAFKGDPQYVTDYIDDIITHLRETELVNSVTGDFMKNQFDVTPRMRAILVDWLVEVIYI